MHENYDPKTFENDIAILKLSQDAQFTQSVQPACLPIGDSDYNNVKVNISMTLVVEFCGVESTGSRFFFFFGLSLTFTLDFYKGNLLTVGQNNFGNKIPI